MGEGLPINRKSHVQNRRRQESGHEGLHTHDASVRRTAHHAHVARTEEAIRREEVQVLQPQQNSILVQLETSRLEGGRNWWV